MTGIAAIVSGIVSFGAAMVQTVTGFGYGLILMSILPHFFLTTNAWTCTAGIVGGITSATNAWKFREYVNLKKALAPAISFFPVSWLMIRYAGSIRESYMKRGLGFCLVLLSIYFIFYSKKIRIKPNLRNGLIAGAIAAVFSGLFSVGGPPIAAYVIGTCDDKNEYTANIQTFFMLTTFYNTVLRILNGYITKEIWIVSGICLIAALAGVFVGRRIISRINGEQQRKYVYALTMISGILLMI